MLGIFLFLLTNIAVMGLVSITMSAIHIEQYTGNGTYLPLLIMAGVMGFAGSLISLFLSKIVAKRAMGVSIIKKDNYRNEDEKWLYETVEKLAKKAKIGMPEVGIYDGQANAFATGWNRNNALVAVSTGLYNSMTLDEVEAVLGHEIGHVASGDMVTSTLLQGVLNTFVIFFARIIGQIIDKAVFKTKDGNGIGYYIVTFILEILFTILASIIVMWFSRYREFKADKKAAELVNPDSMISALERLGGLKTEPLPDKMVSMGIAGGKLANLFSTHPTIEKRVEALKVLKTK